MDPYVSRLVSSVTEYSATQGSSGFHEQYWPGMYTARLLLSLKQGKRSLEDFIQEYLDVANDSDFPDDVLIDFFCDGINQPLKSQLIREGPRSSLSQFMYYALLTVGSAFTVGVAEERYTAPNCVITVALEHAHKMAATTTPRSVITANHKPSQVPADVKEPSQVPADVKEPSQVPADVKEPSQVPADVKEPSQVPADVKEPSQVTANVKRSSQATVDHHKSSQATSDLVSQSKPQLIVTSQSKPQLIVTSQAKPQLIVTSQAKPQLIVTSPTKAQLIVTSQARPQ